mmetsp:Transcript_18116/g.45421  ORF Transcript_18116/g.45421 Transcript_18116/m.45421 type:complete len:222 (-) Transcript_18116:349-1014(-)
MQSRTSTSRSRAASCSSSCSSSCSCSSASVASSRSSRRCTRIPTSRATAPCPTPTAGLWAPARRRTTCRSSWHPCSPIPSSSAWRRSASRCPGALRTGRRSAASSPSMRPAAARQPTRSVWASSTRSASRAWRRSTRLSSCSTRSAARRSACGTASRPCACLPAGPKPPCAPPTSPAPPFKSRAPSWQRSTWPRRRPCSCRSRRATVGWAQAVLVPARSMN